MKDNLLSFVFGMIFALSISAAWIATTYNSADVMYILPGVTKVTLNMVKWALDQLFNRVSNYNKYYHSFGDSTTSSSIDYGLLNKNAFVRISEDNMGTSYKEACLIKNWVLACFMNNCINWASNKYLIQAFLSDATGSVENSSVRCTDGSNNMCYANSGGLVECRTGVGNWICTISASGDVNCR